MCGRIAQYSDLRLFSTALGWEGIVAEHAAGARARYNVAPRTLVWTMHRLGHDAQPSCDAIRWSYKPDWASGRPDVPRVINARMEKVASSPFYRPLWKQGKRAIVPADGWYEWPVVDGEKRPQFITRKDGPNFFAALACYPPTSPDEPDGEVVIITLDADGGLVDVHDRRPAVLSEDDARLWLSPHLQPDAAFELLRTQSLKADAFHWWEVGKAVGNVKNEGPQLARPVG